MYILSNLRQESCVVMMPPLLIVRAAIRGDFNGIHSVPQPGRHCDVIRDMRESGYDGSVHGDRQGFLLSDGSFVTRRDAMQIAINAGQLVGGRSISSTLTTEDLW